MKDEPRRVVTRDIEQPPGGWKYTVPETGVQIKAPYAASLLSRVKQHMAANSIPIPGDFKEVFEDAACRESELYGPFCGGAEPPVIGGMPVRITIGTAQRFIQTMMQVAKDRAFVSREEAERRAAICMQCPLVGHASGCSACNAAFKSVSKLLTGFPLQMEPYKEFCGACGCYLPLKAWIPNETLDRAETEKPPYHERCWRLEAKASDVPPVVESKSVEVPPENTSLPSTVVEQTLPAKPKAKGRAKKAKPESGKTFPKAS